MILQAPYQDYAQLQRYWVTAITIIAHRKLIRNSGWMRQTSGYLNPKVTSMSPNYKDSRPIPSDSVYMLGQFPSPRTGRLYMGTSPSARHERRYTKDTYEYNRPDDVKPWKNGTKKKGSPAWVCLTKAFVTRNTATEKRCGEIILWRAPKLYATSINGSTAHEAYQ